MSKEREKVKCKTELEFITEVADDCVAHLKDKDREYLISNPYAIDYHFSYCLYIRNHYIHNRDFSDVNLLELSRYAKRTGKKLVELTKEEVDKFAI